MTTDDGRGIDTTAPLVQLVQILNDANRNLKIRAEMAEKKIDELQRQIAIMADTDQKKKICELEMKVTKLEENLRKAYNNIRELNETMTQTTIRSERAIREMIQSQQLVPQLYGVDTNLMMYGGNLNQHGSMNGNNNKVDGGHEVVVANHENAMVRDGMQNALDDSIDDNEEEMDEDNRNDEHRQQEIEQQQPPAVIGRAHIKYGRGRSNRTSATIACKKCGDILKNYYNRLFNHAAGHLDNAFYCCQLCTTFKSKSYKSSNTKRHLRTVHKSIDATEYDDNRDLYKVEFKQSLWECFEYDYGI